MIGRVRVTGVVAGVLQGRIAPGAAPEPLSLAARGQILGPVRVVADAQGWALSAPLPARVLEEGVTVLTLQDADGVVHARYPIAAGQGVGDDVLVALAGLEADLAALRRAYLTTMADPPLTRAERPLLLAEAVAAMAALVPEVRPGWRPPCPLPRRIARRVAPPSPRPGLRR